MSYGGGGSGSGSIHASSDVALNNPTDNQVLTYSASLAKWQNAAAGNGPAGPAGLSWRGTFNGATTYGVNDAVAYTVSGLTASYINLVGSTGTAPPAPSSGSSNATWGLLASPGAGSNGGAGTSLSSLATGEETVPRQLAGQNNITLMSGTLVVVYFTATKTETVNNLITATGTAAAGGTLSRMGVYAADRSSGVLSSLIASTATTTTNLWVSAYQPVSAASNNVGALSAPWSKVAGTDYAIGLLFVGSTAPNLVGNLVAGGSGDGGVAPRICGKLTGQTDLPSSANTIATYGFAAYVATA